MLPCADVAFSPVSHCQLSFLPMTGLCNCKSIISPAINTSTGSRKTWFVPKSTECYRDVNLILCQEDLSNGKLTGRQSMPFNVSNVLKRLQEEKAPWLHPPWTKLRKQNTWGGNHKGSAVERRTYPTHSREGQKADAFIIMIIMKNFNRRAVPMVTMA